MRFLDFVLCGHKASPRHPAPRRAAAGAAVVPAVTLLPESCAATAAATPPHVKRGRRAAGVLGSGAAPQWRPMLGAISEDGVLRADAAAREKGGRRRAAQAGKPGKAKAAPGARPPGRDYRDHYRHFTAAAVFPAFAPMAFLF